MARGPAGRTARTVGIVGIVVTAIAALLVGVLLLRPFGTNAQTLEVTSAGAFATPAPSAWPTARAPAAVVPAPTLRGHILNAEGNPVTGAAVHVIAHGLPIAMLGETTSDEAGGFSFAKLPASRVRVAAGHDPEGVVTSAELDAAEGKTTEVTLVLAASGVRGTVVDGEGHALAGVTVSAGGVPWIIPSATTDAEGAFHLAAVPNEATALDAVARGYRPAHVALAHREIADEPVVHLRLDAASAVSGDARDVDGKPVRAQIVACEGQPSEVRAVSADDGTFELPPSAIGCNAIALTDDSAPSDAVVVVENHRLSLRLKPGGSLEGSVVDERGDGIASFSVGIESSSTPHGSIPSGTKSFDNVRGIFHWETLAPGRYVLTATATGTATGRPPTRSSPIEIAGGVATRGVRIVIAQGGSVTGRVYDGRHLPLAGVDLQFDAVSSIAGSSAEAKTDSAGHYVLGGAPLGPFTLRVQKEGFRARLLSGLRVDPRGMLTQDITLSDADGGAGYEFAGIGAILGQTPSGISLMSVLPGEAAERAGLRAGDRIRQIDGEDTDTLSIADTLQRVRGIAGTSVGVSVLRPSTGATLDVVVVRANIVR